MVAVKHKAPDADDPPTLRGDFTTTLVPKPLLRIVQAPPEERERPEQDCTRCGFASNCWDKKATDRIVVLNLLTCRIQRNIERDKSAETFLALIDLPLQSLAARAIEKGATAPHDAIVRDLKQNVIDRLMRTYVLGGVGYPLYYLFGSGKKKGAIVWDAINLQRQQVKERKEREEAHAKERELENLQSDDVSQEEYVYDLEVKKRLDIARSIIDDGVTLTSLEHRVVSFALAFSDARRSGKDAAAAALGRFARHVEKSRGAIRRVFLTASRKIVSATLRLEMAKRLGAAGA